MLECAGDVSSGPSGVESGLVVLVHVSTAFGEFVGFGVAIDVFLVAAVFDVLLFFLAGGIGFSVVVEVCGNPFEQEHWIVSLSDALDVMEQVGIFVFGVVTVSIKDSLDNGDGAFAV